MEWVVFMIVYAYIIAIIVFLYRFDRKGGE